MPLIEAQFDVDASSKKRKREAEPEASKDSKKAAKKAKRKEKKKQMIWIRRWGSITLLSAWMVSFLPTMSTREHDFTARS